MTWDAADWTAAGAWATVAVGSGAAWAALRQVRESRHLREAQAQPFIVVALEPDPIDQFMVNLRVENIGQTLARDVKFTFDPPLKSVMDAKADDDEVLADSPLVKEGIPTMPPGMKIERIFDVVTLWENGEPPVRRYDVEVNYSDRRGQPQEPLRYPIDFGPFLSGTFTLRKSPHDGVKALLGIEKILKGWTDGKGLGVWARDGDAKDAEHRRRVAERLARQKGQPGDGSEPEAR
jgi:hypothetical protein